MTTGNDLFSRSRERPRRARFMRRLELLVLRVSSVNNGSLRAEATLPAEARYGVQQQLPEAVGKEGPTKELHRLAVLVSVLIPPNLDVAGSDQLEPRLTS